MPTRFWVGQSYPNKVPRARAATCACPCSNIVNSHLPLPNCRFPHPEKWCAPSPLPDCLLAPGRLVPARAHPRHRVAGRWTSVARDGTGRGHAVDSTPRVALAARPESQVDSAQDALAVAERGGIGGLRLAVLRAVGDSAA